MLELREEKARKAYEQVVAENELQRMQERVKKAQLRLAQIERYHEIRLSCSFQTRKTTQCLKRAEYCKDA